MARRGYTGGANKPTLTSPVVPSDTLLHNTAPAGWPVSGTPIAAAIDRGLATEEKVLVTAWTSSTMTVTRGYDGTTAQNHASGQPIELVITSIDADEANAHVNATVGVHGLGGADRVVGRASTDTLTNKSIDGGSNTLTGILRTSSPQIDAALAVVEGASTTETAARIAADNTLQANINAEASTRATGVSTNASAITTETAARIAGDANEATLRDGAIATAVTNERVAVATLTGKTIGDAGSTILGLAGNVKIVTGLNVAVTTNSSGDFGISIPGITAILFAIVTTTDGPVHGNLVYAGNGAHYTTNGLTQRVYIGQSAAVLASTAIHIDYLVVGT